MNTIVGRDGELAALAALLDVSVPGARALVLEGEAGIGKTALWRWAADEAIARGHLVLSCSTSESEKTLPFAGLGDLLDPVFGQAAPSLTPNQRLAIQTALALVAPTEAFDTLTVCRAVLALIRVLAAHGSLVVAIDDLQWLDDSTRQVVEFAVRRLSDVPVRYLLARRLDHEAIAGAAFERQVVPERLTTLHIGPLGIGELATILRSNLDLSLPRPRLIELHQISGGNPFYALEIARSLESQGASAEEALTVPSSLGELLRERVDQLSMEAKHAALLTAAASRPTLELIEQAGGGSDALMEAIQRNVLEVDGQRLRFSHPLLASVTYGSASPWQKRALHQNLASVTADPEEQALHLALATGQADAQVAAQVELAADRAARRGALSAAAELAEHAGRLTPDDGLDDLLRRSGKCAEYHLAAGNTGRGRRLLEDVVARSPAGRERAELLLRLGRARYLDDDVAAAHQVFEQALAEAGDDSRLLAATEQALAFTAMYGGDIGGALAHAASSLELAEAVGDPGLLALALGRVALESFLAGQGLDREMMERAVSLESHVVDAPVEWLPSYAYAGCATWCGDFATARDLYAGLYQAALERGDERSISTLLFAMSQLESAAGDWQLASRYAVDAVDRSRQSGLASLQAYSLSALALVSTLLGRTDSARQAAEEGLEIVSRTSAVAPSTVLIGTLGFLELSLGDYAATHARLGPLAELMVRFGVGEPTVVPLLPDEIEAMIALGRLDDARPLVALLEERGQVLDRPWAIATGARSAALLAAAGGDIGAAREAIASALLAHERLPQPFELARTLLVQGQIERRARNRGEARTVLSRALTIFDELGAVLWSAKAATEIERIPGRAPASGGLTSTERQIAELIAQGFSNKEAASRLFVSVRTVEANLSKVYAKLGVRSRTALASRLRATPDP